MTNNLITGVFCCLLLVPFGANFALSSPVQADGFLDFETDKALSYVWQMYKEGAYQAGLEKAQRLVEALRNSNSRLAKAEAFFALATVEKKLAFVDSEHQANHLDSSIEHYNAAVSEYLAIGENIQASKAVYELGKAYQGKNNLVEACRHVRRAIELFQSGIGKYKTFSNLRTTSSPLVIFHRRERLVCSESNAD